VSCTIVADGRPAKLPLIFQTIINELLLSLGEERTGQGSVERLVIRSRPHADDCRRRVTLLYGSMNVSLTLVDWLQSASMSSEIGTNEPRLDQLSVL